MTNSKVFKINEYITLKFEDNKTKLYVKGKYFRQCLQLVLQVPKEEIEHLSTLNSIDEFATYHKTGEVSPEAAFWGHCSTLQAWVESGYDTRLMHSNLAFPLLKKLTELSDDQAKKVFKEEIAKRFSTGFPATIEYLLKKGYLDYLSKEEIETIDNNFQYTYFQEFFDSLKIELIEGLSKFGFKKVPKKILERLSSDFLEDPSKGKSRPVYSHYIETLLQFDYSAGLVFFEANLKRVIENQDLEKLEEYAGDGLFCLIKKKDINRIVTEEIYDLLIEAMKKFLDYFFIENPYLEEVHDWIFNFFGYMIFRSKEVFLDFFNTNFPELEKKYQEALTSYLLVHEGDLPLNHYDKIHKYIAPLNWSWIAKQVFWFFPDKYLRFNCSFLVRIERNKIPFFKNFFKQIETLLHWNRFNLREIVSPLENLMLIHPIIIEKFIKEKYIQLGEKYQCLFVGAFLVSRETNKGYLKSIREIIMPICEQQDPINLAKTTRIYGVLNEAIFQQLGLYAIKMALYPFTREKKSKGHNWWSHYKDLITKYGSPYQEFINKEVKDSLSRIGRKEFMRDYENLSYEGWIYYLLEILSKDYLHELLIDDQIQLYNQTDITPFFRDYKIEYGEVTILDDDIEKHTKRLAFLQKTSNTREEFLLEYFKAIVIRLDEIDGETLIFEWFKNHGTKIVREGIIDNSDRVSAYKFLMNQLNNPDYVKDIYSEIDVENNRRGLLIYLLDPLVEVLVKYNSELKKNVKSLCALCDRNNILTVLSENYQKYKKLIDKNYRRYRGFEDFVKRNISIYIDALDYISIYIDGNDYLEYPKWSPNNLDPSSLIYKIWKKRYNHNIE
ncbi:MAG: hypothetical protein GF311_07165 [Candidatus Lokiarchaeota archaeon]|nr:hypothetical protein [Candidatus Lokiarchaeota archaeon]